MKKKTLWLHTCISLFLVGSSHCRKYRALSFIWSGDYLFNDMGIDLDSPESQAAKQESDAFTEEIVKEGIVLLRNENNVLPLTTGNVNLFGWSSTNVVVGGSGGSGGSSGAEVDIRTSLIDAGFTVNEDLYNAYVSYDGDRSGDPTNPIISMALIPPILSFRKYLSPRIQISSQTSCFLRQKNFLMWLL